MIFKFLVRYSSSDNEGKRDFAMNSEGGKHEGSLSGERFVMHIRSVTHDITVKIVERF